MSESAYRNALRGAVRGYWSGLFSFDEFYTMMLDVIEIGLRNAWYEGAALCFIEIDDLTEEELAAMKAAIIDETQFIDSFADAIEAGSKKNKGKLAPLLNRVESWVVRYKDVMNRAKIKACADQKLIWVLGATEEHCSSCLKITGKVKRGSTWDESEWRPQSHDLECGGWNCDCNLEPTQLPLSKGKLPSFP